MEYVLARSDVPSSSNGAPAWVAFAALGVSIVALVVTTVQAIYTYRRNGALVKIEGDTRPLPLQVAGRPVRAAKRLQMLTLVVRNVGRAPTSVDQILLRTSRKVHTGVSFEGEVDRSRVIEKEATRKYFVSVKTLQTMTKQFGPDLAFRPVVKWGAGRKSVGRLVRVHVEPPPPPPANAQVITIGPAIVDLGWTPDRRRWYKPWVK